jgi:hypothetical protein
MDVIMTALADHERLASQGDHSLHPPWSILPSCFVEVGQFANVMDFTVSFTPTYFTPVCFHAFQYVRPLIPQVKQLIMYR